MAYSLNVPSGWGLRYAGYLAVPLLLIYVFNRISRSQKRNQFLKRHGCLEPPSDTAWYPFGLNLLVSIRLNATNGRLLNWMKSRYDDRGNTVQIKILGMKETSTIEPANIKTILSSNFEDYGVRFRVIYGSFAFFGEGVLTQDGPHWKHSRELLRKHFKRSQSEILNLCDQPIDSFIASTPSTVFNYKMPFERLLMDITVRNLFGTRTQSATPDYDEDIAMFNDAIDNIYVYLTSQSSFFDQYWITGKGPYLSHVAKCYDFIDRRIAYYETTTRALDQENEPDVHHASPFLSSLLDETKDKTHRRSNLLQFFLASRDTTAILLHWTFLFLAKYPKIQEKLRASIKAELGPSTESPTPADLKKLHYLSYILKEVLRLFPPVSVNNRQALRDTILPVGGGPDGTAPVAIMAGEFVGYNVFAMHRRPDLYGPDANHFRPERWDPETDEGKRLKALGMGYLPFHGGPRVCLGQEMALLEASYVTVRLLQAFSAIEPAPGCEIEPPGQERVDVKFLIGPYSKYAMIFRK